MPAMKQLTFVLRLVAFAAFVVFGVIWSGDPGNETIAALWAVSFGVTALLALLADVPADRRPTLAGMWEALPSPSKNPADYR
jgi:hypothetical protein